jgi:translation initiation factor RLI1
MLAGGLKPNDLTIEMPKLNFIYKPQCISPKFEGTVKALLVEKFGDNWR